MGGIVGGAPSALVMIEPELPGLIGVREHSTSFLDTKDPRTLSNNYRGPWEIGEGSVGPYGAVIIDSGWEGPAPPEFVSCDFHRTKSTFLDPLPGIY